MTNLNLKSRAVGIGICLALAANASMAATAKLKDQLRDSIKIEKYKLDNGLTVIFHEDPSIPMVSYHQWFKVGSRHEKKGRTGLAHFFEHLMFKGSKNYSSDFYEKFITGNGGYNNAFTTRDYTGYFTLIPSDKLETVVKIEADRLANLKFDPAQIQSEREVVKEERRYRYDNDPDGALYVLTNETIFKSGAYSWPVIGYMTDLNSTKLEELQDFYRTFYSPNNAVVVVAGSFDRSKAKKWIAEAYGNIKAQKIPEPLLGSEPEQTAPRHADRKMSVQAPKLSLAYRTVNTFSQDDYSLQALASLLGGGPSSRLYKNLVRKKQLVTNVSADQTSDVLDGTFSIDFDLRTGVKPEQVIAEVDREIASLQKNLADQKEIDKVKNEVILGYTGSLKTMGGKARLLAYSETIYGDPLKFLDDLDSFSAISSESVRQVAKTYLKNTRRSTVMILPK